MPNRAAEFPKLTIAAIDIGTNSAHLVIAEMDHIGEMRILDSDKVTLRLGQALGEDGKLSDDGIKRTVEALKHMREIIEPYGAKVRAVATHATREASNHRRLLNEIKKHAGISVDVIDGIEEARLSFLGMRYGLALSDVECLGVDVGGGSTEVIVAKDEQMDFVSSLHVGAVTLTARYFKNGATAEAYKEMREHVRSRLAPLPEESRKFAFDRALASSGTAKALAYLHSRLYGGAEVQDPNGYVLPREGLFKIAARFGELLTPEKIHSVTGLDESRCEIIVAGTVIFEELTRLFKVKEWIITSYGLREGLVADTFYRHYGRTSSELPDVQWNSIKQFARRLQLNEGHAAQVRKLSLRLLDLLTPILRQDATGSEQETNTKILEGAAYLREAGKFISAPQYHKHSQYVISNSRIPGFTEEERQLMGLIARYQRKGVPSQDHAECADMSSGELKRLRFLSGIVRLASALDRTRQARVLDVSVKSQGDEIIVSLGHDPERPPDVEIHKAKLEKNALEKSFDRKIKLITHTTESV